MFFAIFYAELTGTLYASTFRNKQMRAYESNRWKAHSRFSQPSQSSVFPWLSKESEAVNEISFPEMPSVPKQNITYTLNDKLVEEDKVDIGGPGQPEMSSFKSAGVDNMVNLFTGDFSYNIPLLDLGGYPVNIFYNGGVSMDQEATWVGLGWNLNPGTINRNMRGLPDDYNGKDEIVNVQSLKPDRTIGVSHSRQIETAGRPLSAGYSLGIFYNGRRGLGLEADIRAEYSPQKMLSMLTKDEKTLNDTIPAIDVSINGGLQLNSQNGLTANVGFAVHMASEEKKYRYGLGTNIGYNSRFGLTDLSIDAEKSRYKTVQTKVEAETNYSKAVVHQRNYHVSNINFARSSYTPTIRMPLTRNHSIVTLKFGDENYGVFSHSSLSGYVQTTSIKPRDTVQTKPAYGFMHHREAAADENAIMDFNRINDGTFTLKSPMISVPAYTYDVFTINGEGTGGSFRGYQGNLGFVKDNETRSRSSNFQVVLEIGKKKNFSWRNFNWGIVC
ncbi:MAG: hypothetical protein NVV59_08930 [Chitinophagaceae bacterium]|nr:hypothetical protein [Chitinophagaceae bacterium]